METETELRKTALKKLREPFPPEQISKLPKPTAAQTKEVRDDYKKGIRCEICGGWHHPKVVHLDYVGHAALTSRLLDCDTLWNWEPIATDDAGSPILDSDGGMWIFLTVCGLTRRGYGDADGKTGTNATKERIGDALRNAAMRFGAALDLWSKADLHDEAGGQDEKKTEGKKEEPKTTDRKTQPKQDTPAEDRKLVEQWLTWIDGFTKSNLDTFLTAWENGIAKSLHIFPEKNRNELTIAKREMEKFLMDKTNAK